MKKKFLIKFMDRFTFATLHKEAELTPEDHEKVILSIKNAKPVHVQRTESATWRWIPIKVWEEGTPDYIAAKAIMNAPTRIF